MSTTSLPPNFLYTLDFFRFGLLLSVVTQQEISVWADTQLLANHYWHQDAPLADLSLCQQSSRKELAAWISTIIGQEKTITGSRLLLGRLYQLQDLSTITPKLGLFIPIMYLSHQEEELVEEIQFNCNFDNHFYPMTNAEKQVVQKNALDFLGCYQAYQLAQLEQLPMLDKNLELALEQLKTW
ncbi:MAG: hypothetical protein AB8E82_18185 [Aureispira sp.]